MGELIAQSRDSLAHEQRLFVTPLVEIVEGEARRILTDARRADGDAVEDFLNFHQQRRVTGDGADAITRQAVSLRKAEQLHQSMLCVCLTGHQRVVVALDAQTGEILWEEVALTGPPEKKWENSTYATPTPATDGERVYAYFGQGLATLDFEGRVLWRQEFDDYTAHTRYGAAGSPVLTDTTVVLGRE